MKHFPWTAVVLAGLFGCGPATEGPTLLLRLKLPTSMEKDSPRFRRLVARAVRLEIECVVEGRGPYRLSFAPQEWEAIPITRFEIRPKDKIKLRVNLWDRTRLGQLRSYPVLQGQETFEWDGQRETPLAVTVRLVLQVSARDYD